MKLKINNLIFNTETCSHTRKVRITKEELSSRSYVVKTEQLCRQIHNKEHYFLIVVLEKYTDNQLTSTYSWLQYVGNDELQEFLDLPDYHKPRKTKELNDELQEFLKPKQPKEPKEPKKPKPIKEPKQPKEPKEPKPKKESTLDRKAYRHQYYEAHKEELKQRAKQNYQEHKDRYQQYYQEHKDKWQKYNINKKEK